MNPTSIFDPAEWSRVYDDPHKRGQFAVFQRSAELAHAACVPLMRAGDHWLDLGSGSGHLARALRRTGAIVAGVDHDVAMVRLTGHGVVARVEQLPIADDTLSGVVSVSLVGCLPDSDAFYGEVHRVLKPGGHAVITYTNEASWLLQLNYLFANAGGQRFARYRATSVRQRLEHAGFAVRSLQFYNCVLHARAVVFPPSPVAHLLERLQMERLARNFVLVVRKI
jgi:malonyl-CoA O-methyltransferase